MNPTLDDEPAPQSSPGRDHFSRAAGLCGVVCHGEPGVGNDGERSSGHAPEGDLRKGTPVRLRFALAETDVPASGEVVRTIGRSGAHPSYHQPQRCRMVDLEWEARDSDEQ